MAVLQFPTARKAAYRNPPVDHADLPENVVSLHRLAATQCPPDPTTAPVPELAQSPELALIIAIYAALPAKTRKRTTRELLSMAWRNRGSEASAPNAAYELINRLNTILDRERGG